ncbi:RHS repeat-associated core domain-containing protein [Salmonella enterica]
MRVWSADAGITISLNDAADRPFLRIRNIDASKGRSEAFTQTFQYESPTLPGRLLTITEQTAGNMARISERFIWGNNTNDAQDYNLAGGCVQHYDTAGLLQIDSIGILGSTLSVTRRLLKAADDSDYVVDWQGSNSSVWNSLVDSELFTTEAVVNTTGSVIATTDAKGNTQSVKYDVAGLLKSNTLRLKSGVSLPVVVSLDWSAGGQKMREEYGNGVVSSYLYEPETQRLSSVKTERPSGHSVGAKVLQKLSYQYDPVGNVLAITNDAEEVRYWRNQQVVPESIYTYDTLYQLVSATGRETANSVQQTSDLPQFSTFDSATFTNYTRLFTYDVAGNLTKIAHSAPASGNNYTTTLTVSDRNNRAVLSVMTENPAAVDALFSASGQQTQLLPSQSLLWTSRGELLMVVPVERDGAADDSESYRYDANNQRVFKFATQQTNGTTQTRRVIYLPALELRSVARGTTKIEDLQVITVTGAGRAQVQVLHWESGQPTGIANEQVRYSYDNFTGSNLLEVDENGEVISLEEFYPYGGTSLQAARSQTEADYKIRRYSGKERDATGLYYYGLRYYQPWTGRWLSADQAGTADGLNLFTMVKNNPVSLYDPDGQASVYPISDARITFEIENATAVIDEAISVLSDKKLTNDTKAKIRQIFSNASSKKKIKTSLFKDELLLRFKAMRENLTKSQIMYDESAFDRGRLAYVHPTDIKRNIFISSDFLKNAGSVDNLATLLHEVSHFSDIQREGKYKKIYAEFGSGDHFYMQIPKEHWFDATKYIKSAISNFSSHYQAMNRDETITLAGVKTNRLNIALENADTLAIVALNLGYKKMKPLSELPTVKSKFIRKTNKAPTYKTASYQ